MSFRRTIFLALAAILVVVSGPGSRVSANSVDLRIEDGARNQVLILGRDGMKALGWETLTTITPWTKKPIAFGGVSLKRILDHAGITAPSVEAIALNDYRANVDVAEAVEWGAFVACEADGEPISVRDKGPCWIVFPWSQRPELDNGNVQAVSVWQLHVLRAL